MKDTVKFDFQEAQELFRKQKYEKAFSIYERLASQGHLDSLYILGYMYEKGLGIDQNYESAFECYQEAAFHKEDGANWQIQMMYEQGVGVPQNKKKANQIYDKLICHSNGRCVRNGQEMLEKAIEKMETGEYKEAFEIYKDLAEKGVAVAQCYLSVMYSCGLGVCQNEKESERWFNAAEEHEFFNEITSKGRIIVRKRHKS